MRLLYANAALTTLTTLCSCTAPPDDPPKRHSRSSIRGEYSYLQDVCAPTDEHGIRILDIPCNSVSAIQLQCTYGPSFAPTKDLNSSTHDEHSAPIDVLVPQPNSTQRVCICESQFFDQNSACAACFFAHGAGEELPDTDFGEYGYGGRFDGNLMSGFSSSYCAVTATPTARFVDALAGYSNAISPMTTNPWGGYATNLPNWVESRLAEEASTRRFSDPLGINSSATQISLYYTLSVTGTPAYQVVETPGTAGLTGPETFASPHVANGQIVPTAAPVTTVTHSALQSKFSENASTYSPTTRVLDVSNSASERQIRAAAYVAVLHLILIATFIS